MGSFFYYEHQGKGLPYARALQQAGYQKSNKWNDPNLVCGLYDYDFGGASSSRYPSLVHLRDRDIPVLIYPHSARPMVQYDGMYSYWPHTKAMITIGPGHRKVMEAIGYQVPVEVCGWALCDQVPWKAIAVGTEPIKVLFGPIHPNANGFLHSVDKAQNALVFQRLLEVPGIQLTVRHIKRLDLGGLWAAPGVKYVLANPNGSTGEIDAADVVVGHQTFAWLAVARGKPLIMFGDKLIPHSGNRLDGFRWAKNYEAYREIMRYPLEVETDRNGDYLRRQIEQAMSQDVGEKWRKQFVGKQLDPKQFAKTVQKYLN